MSRSRLNRAAFGAIVGATASVMSCIAAICAHPESDDEIMLWGIGIFTPLLTSVSAAMFGRASCGQAVYVNPPEINNHIAIDIYDPSVSVKKT